MRPLSATAQRALDEVKVFPPGRCLAVFVEVRFGERTLRVLERRGLVRVVRRDGTRCLEVVS